LPDEVVDFILQADTAFIASVYKSEKATAEKYPSHAGMNARSGLPGFLRVRPSDGRTVVIPDYSGNRFVSSLGNIESSGLAGLTIVSFTTGDILYLTGTAENHVGPAALKIMARHASLTTVKVTGYTFVRDALPVRQQSGTSVERSPYSPKIKYLVEEMASETGDNEGHQAYLQEAVQLSSDLAVFKFKVAAQSGAPRISIRPGQAIVLDFMDWIGPPRYRHMADAAPESINDDRVRTWTVSSAHEGQNVTSFELTMRKMPGGAVTGALFDALKPHSFTQWGQPIKFDNSVRAGIVGITGDFSLSPESINDLWVAGGIGITPFLAMLQALGDRRPAAQGNISLVLATREPEIMLRLIQPSLAKMPPTLKVELEIFTKDFDFDKRVINSSNVRVTLHQGRVEPSYWATAPKNKNFFICGPNGFADSVVNGLQAASVQPSQIHREGFY
jgi:ferredoxin-NADP reductase